MQGFNPALTSIKKFNLPAEQTINQWLHKNLKYCPFSVRISGISGGGKDTANGNFPPAATSTMRTSPAWKKEIST
jgi:hypothetical protein